MKISQKFSEPSRTNVMKWQRDLERDMANYEAVRARRSQTLLTSEERWDVPRNGDFIIRTPNKPNAHIPVLSFLINLFHEFERIPLRIKNTRQV